jgi:hypothetical protein
VLNCHSLSGAAADLQLVYAAGNATGQALALDDFYSNELVKNYYKNHVSFIMNHVNKYTGLQFKVWVASIAMPAPIPCRPAICPQYMLHGGGLPA